MNAVALRSWSLFRRRWPAWMGLALVLGVVGGTCMAFGQAARHTQVTFGEFVREQRAADVVLTGASGFGFVGSVDLDQVDRLPEVAESARAFVGLPFSGTTDDGREVGVSDVFPLASEDGRLGTTIERWKMTSGRAAEPGRVDEATASSELAQRMHLRVGSTLRLRFYDSSHFAAVAARFLQQWPVHLRARVAGSSADPADGPTVQVHIVGVEASPLEFPPLLTDLAPVLHLTPAFAHSYATRIVGSPLSYVRLKKAGDLRAFQLAVERLAKGKPVSFVMTLANQRAKVERSLHAEALVLAIVTGLLAVAGGVAIAQALARQATSEAGDDEMLRALGMERSQRRAVAYVRSAVITAGAVAVALPVAWLASPLMLLSLARMASLHDGFQLDGSTAVVGGASVLLFGLLCGAVTARVSRLDRPSTRRTRSFERAGNLAERAGLPMSVAMGVRLAVRRRDRSAPAVMTVMGAALGVATITLAATFTAVLHRDLSEPARYGWNWDLKLGAPGLPDLASELVPPLRDDARVSDLTVGTVAQVDIGSTRLDVFAIDAVRGSAVPTLTSGHAPRSPTEMVLGDRSLRALHTDLGGTVRARIGARAATFRVVGRAIFPEFGDSGQLGTGAWTTVAGLRRIAPDSAPLNTYLVGLRPGARSRATETAIRRAVAPLPVRDAARPEDLVNLSRGEGLLVALGALLAALVLAVLLHALLTSVRRDRSEHAVVRALGCTRGQTRSTVVWQSLTLGATSFVIGVPVGLVATHWLWAAYADHLGIATDVVVPFRVLALVAAGTVGVALVAAVVPAWLAGRGGVAQGLRADD